MLSRIPLNLSRSQPDRRDYVLNLKSPNLHLASFVNLDSLCPPVFDQGYIGSCTAQCVSCMYSALFRKNTKLPFLPARLYIYYNTRRIQNTISYDSGASLRDTMKAIAHHGACPENMWPYDSWRLFSIPNSNCYKEGALRQALSYASVPIQLQTMKQLLSQKHIFVIGLLIFSSFFSGGDTVPVPNTTTEQLLGGHAVAIIGYDDKRQAFLARNSWGTSWGVKGNFYLPYRYATNRNLAFDAWVLYSIEIPRFHVRKPPR